MKRIMIFGLLLSVSGCGVVVPLVKSESNLQKLTIGDSREDVAGKMGQPDSRQQPQVDYYLLYEKYAPATDFALGIFTLTLAWWIPAPSAERPYWLYYDANGRLSNWMRAN
jgi:hypothetical protein